MRDVPAQPDLAAADLAPVAARALGVPDARPATWRATPLVHRVINGITGGLYRIEGDAIVGTQHRPWSAVLKVLLPPGAAMDQFSPSADPTHWNYWRREPLIYDAGFLADLPPGLAAPRHLGTEERPDGTIRLWLETIDGEIARGWAEARYVRAARLLGRWQGAFAAGARPLPAAPWLSAGWLDAWVPRDPAVVLDPLRDPDAPGHQLLRGLLPPDTAARAAALLRDRDAYLAAIARGPQTFCHRDLWGANLLARPDGRGDEEVVVIDWSSSGNGALADDCANLAFDSAWMFAVAPGDMADFAARLLDAYCQGLRDAGWRGDERLVRATFAAIAALRFGLLAGGLVDFARDEARHALWERRYGRPVAAIVAQRAAVVAHALALADEARILQTS